MFFNIRTGIIFILYYLLLSINSNTVIAQANTATVEARITVKGCETRVVEDVLVKMGGLDFTVDDNLGRLKGKDYERKWYGSLDLYDYKHCTLDTSKSHSTTTSFFGGYGHGGPGFGVFIDEIDNPAGPKSHVEGEGGSSMAYYNLSPITYQRDGAPVWAFGGSVEVGSRRRDPGVYKDRIEVYMKCPVSDEWSHEQIVNITLTAGSGYACTEYPGPTGTPAGLKLFEKFKDRACPDGPEYSVELLNVTPAVARSDVSFGMYDSMPPSQGNGPMFCAKLELPNFIAKGLEVTQGIQNLENKMPLVAGRRTYARFYVEAKTSTSVVNARLRGVRSDGTEILPPLYPEPDILVPEEGAIDRKRLDDAYLFKFPSGSDWVDEGQLQLIAEIDYDDIFDTEIDEGDNSVTVDVEFFATNEPVLSVLGVPLNMHEDGNPQKPIYEYSRKDKGLDEAINHIWRYYPYNYVANVSCPFSESLKPSLHDEPPSMPPGDALGDYLHAISPEAIREWFLGERELPQSSPAPVGRFHALDILERIEEERSESDCGGDAIWLGMVSPYLPLYQRWKDSGESIVFGAGQPNSNVMWAILDPERIETSNPEVQPWYSYGGGVAGHEFGHTRNLPHVSCVGGEAGADENFPHSSPNCRLAIGDQSFFGEGNNGFFMTDVFHDRFGINRPTIVSNDPLVEEDQRAFPLMGYRRKQWISPYHYCAELDDQGVSCDKTMMSFNDQYEHQKHRSDDLNHEFDLVEHHYAWHEGFSDFEIFSYPVVYPQIPQNYSVPSVTDAPFYHLLIKGKIFPDDETQNSFELRRSNSARGTNGLNDSKEYREYLQSLSAVELAQLEHVLVLHQFSESGMLLRSDIINMKRDSNVINYFRFRDVVDYADGAGTFELHYGNSLIKEWIPSANEPVVVLDPYPHTELIANSELKFSSLDNDGGALEHRVYYSSNGGTSWALVSKLGEEDQQYQVADDLRPYSGSANGIFRVSAYDGFYETSADFTPMLVSGSPPDVNISTPTGLIHDLGQTIYLDASASDVEDGTIHNYSSSLSQMVWSSNVDGFLGFGHEVSTRMLSAGFHRITYSVQDSSGATGLGAIDLCVGFMPGGICKDPSLTTRSFGSCDNYVAPEELLEPSEYLSNWLANETPFPEADLDDLATDKGRIHTFTDLEKVDKIIVTIKAKPILGTQLNDSINFEMVDENARDLVNRWGSRIGDPSAAKSLLPDNWSSANYPDGYEFVFDMSALPIENNQIYDMMPIIREKGFFDMYIQDDTAVDCIEITVTDTVKPGLFRRQIGVINPNDTYYFPLERSPEFDAVLTYETNNWTNWGGVGRSLREFFTGGQGNRTTGLTINELPEIENNAVTKLVVNLTADYNNGNDEWMAINSLVSAPTSVTPVNPGDFEWSAPIAGLMGGPSIFNNGVNVTITLDLDNLPGGISTIAAMESNGDIDLFFSEGYAVNYITLESDKNSTGNGLSDLDSLMAGVSPFSDDADEDGISNFVEIFELGTDPGSADSDGDGLNDSDELACLAWGPQQIISNSANQVRLGDAVDLNGDGRPDSLFTSRDLDRVMWHKNTDGLGSFGSENVIANGIDAPMSAVGVDLDSDGDHDVLVASENDDTVSWFENDGSGNFGPQQVVTSTADGAAHALAKDIDFDGDLDIIVMSRFDNVLGWYENTDGLGTFSNQNFISNDLTSARFFDVADVDGDGAMDVIGTSLSLDAVAWYPNLDTVGGFGAQNVVSTDVDGAFSVASGDVDNDGDTDLVSAAFHGDSIAWHENTDGLGSFSAKQVVGSANGPITVKLVDIDIDGDLDVLFASADDSTVGWFENTDGLGSFGPKQVIQSGSSVNSAYHVIPEDVDGDGDKDIMITSRFNNRVSWNERLNCSNVFDDDSDDDGMKDGDEVANGFDPLDAADAGLDSDSDGLTNLEEINLGTNPNLADTDGDGVSDFDENTNGTDPLVANASLSGDLTSDDMHTIYISTHDNAEGTQISSGVHTIGTDSFSNVSLDRGRDYYIHVEIIDNGSFEGFLGDFSLLGNTHIFENGSTTLLTNTTDWQASIVGWNNYSDQLVSYGTNGVAPWGNRVDIDSAALWVWPQAGGELAYFTARIIADSDQDGVGDSVDNCPETPNSGQADVDGDGIGDACEDSDKDCAFDFEEVAAGTDPADPASTLTNLIAGIPSATADWPTAPFIETVDASSLSSTGGRAITAVSGVSRKIRTSFQTDADVDIQEIFLSAQGIQNPSTFTIKFFELANVEASTWSSGAQIGPTLTVSGGAVDTSVGNVIVPFENCSPLKLSQRNNGSEGYGIELELVDPNDPTVLTWRHAFDGTDYTVGRSYYESGGGNSLSWDMGLAMVGATDLDMDGFDNEFDNCPDDFNPDQFDLDGDGIGDACDLTPGSDTDGDLVEDGVDNCPNVANASQSDFDSDGIGNACDSNPDNDLDNDGVQDGSDNCPNDPNANQADNDNDGIGNVCDPTPNGSGGGNPGGGNPGGGNNGGISVPLLIPPQIIFALGMISLGLISGIAYRFRKRD